MKISHEVEKYVNDHMNIRAALLVGVLNYSKTARLISKHLSLDLSINFDAIVIALRRLKARLEHKSNENEVIALLKESKIKIKNRILVATIDPEISSTKFSSIEKSIRQAKEDFQIIHGISATTLITSDEFKKDIESTFGIQLIKLRDGLVELTLKSPKSITETNGVIAYLYARLAFAGINIIETMSCFTDTIFIFEEHNLAKALTQLKFT